MTPRTPRGPAIELEPLTTAHIPAIADLVLDPDVLRFTRVPEPTPNDFVEQWFASYDNGSGDGTRQAFAIVEGDGSFLGLALAPVIDRATRTVELGYVLAPAARGRGVATEALRRLTIWALEDLGALRIELFINPENGASQAVARRCGYSLEGVLRSLHFKQDLRQDFQLWSLLPEDR
jgi:RimJ/RimL family protein N-acetyltransferase